MKFKLLGFLSALLTLIAAAVSSTACMALAYQPKEPKCLRK